jgi:hypothetical protein
MLRDAAAVEGAVEGTSPPHPLLPAFAARLPRPLGTIRDRVLSLGAVAAGVWKGPVPVDCSACNASFYSAIPVTPSSPSVGPGKTPKRPSVRWIALVGLVVILAGGIGAYFVSPSLSSKDGRRGTGNVVSETRAREGKRYALLIGVNEYQNLAGLRYAEDDATELADVLGTAGYEVTLLTGAEGKRDPGLAPTRTNVTAHLSRVARKCQKADLLLLAFAGHGMQFDDQAYFCPSDADESKPETMVSLRHVYAELGGGKAGASLLLVDACRGDRRGGVTSPAARAPAGVAALFSCKRGEFAHETERLRHGVFFHFVLRGLRGEAANEDGEVTWDLLNDHVKRQVSRNVGELVGGGARQTPHAMADLEGESPVLLKQEPTKRGGGTLVLQIHPPEARVCVNGKQIAARGFDYAKPEKVEVDPGECDLRVTADTYEPEARRVTVGPGSAEVVAVRLVPVDVAVARWFESRGCTVVPKPDGSISEIEYTLPVRKQPPYRPDGRITRFSLAWPVKGVTNEYLERLAVLSHLRTLWVGSPEITDDGLRHLRKMTTLGTVYLCSTSVTGRGLEHLKGNADLHSLWLGGVGTRVGDEGLEHLTGFKKLSLLRLDGTRVTDAGLKHLGRLAALYQLGLDGTRVTDEGLTHLFGLKQLRVLCLGNTAVTKEGVRRLKAAIPGCTVFGAMGKEL